MRQAFGVIRLIAAAVIIAAIVGQFFYSLEVVADPAVYLVNYFSYFTILSNTVGAIALIVGAVLCFRAPVDPPWFNVAFAAVVTYLATTGVVYNLLLRSVVFEDGRTLAWSNEIVHVAAPIYVLLVWIVSPGRRPIPYAAAWVVIAFPLLWSVYTMIRGAITGWYPYPFLNPENAGGYGVVSVYIVAIAGFIGLAAVGVIALSRVDVWRRGPGALSSR